MRDYGSHVYSIFDGDPNCQHEFQTEQRQGMGTWNADKSTLGGGPLDKHQAIETIESAFCRKCGAWRGQLGLECLSEDTEILTEKGWKTYNSINKKDLVASFNIKKNQLEYQKIEKIFIKKYKGNMIRIKNFHIDMLVTPNHRILHKNRCHSGKNIYYSNLQYLFADKIKIKEGLIIPITSNFNGNISIGEDLAELIGWILSDGSFDKKGYRITIYQSKKEGIKRIIYLLNKLKIKYHVHKRIEKTNFSNDPKQRFYFRFSYEIAKKIRQLIGDKKNPNNELLFLKKAELKRLFKGIYLGDGSGQSIYGKPEKYRDWLQILILHLNKRPIWNKKKQSIGFCERNTTEVSRTNKRKPKDREYGITKANYEGIVWCIKTKNSNFLARRQKKVFITGNSNFDLFLKHLLDIFDEVKRVLKPTGSIYVNMGDTFAGGGTGQTNTGKHNYPPEVMTVHNKPSHKVANIKDKSLCMIPERFAMGMIDHGWILRNQIIWCLDGDTELFAEIKKKYTKLKLSELYKKRINKIKLPIIKKGKSNWVEIVNIYKKGIDECYEIELTNGLKITTTENHIFPYKKNTFAKKSNDYMKMKCKKVKELSVKDYLFVSKKFILNNKNVKYTYNDGLAVGIWVAEGSFLRTRRYNNGTNLSKNALKRWAKEKGHSSIKDYLKNRTDIVGLQISHTDKNFIKKLKFDIKIYNELANHSRDKKYLKLIKIFVEGVYSSDKHFSNEIWNTNKKFIKGILDGYLQGDGHWDKKNKRWRLGFTSKNKKLMSDLCTICKILNYDIRIQGKNQIQQMGQIKTEFDKRNTFQDLYVQKIRSIKKIGRKNVYDIELKSVYGTFSGKSKKKIGTTRQKKLNKWNNLFCINNGILTHNSKPNAMPTSAKDRYSVDFEKVFFFSKSKKYFFNTQYEPYAKSTENDSRMGKIQQLSKTIKEGYEDAMMQNPKELRQNIFSKGLGLGRIKRTTWTITTKGFSGSHFATFPEELVETPIKASCPEQVCKQCGKPRGFSSRKGNVEGIKKYDVTGYTNCGCNKGFEPGIALDMFFGAGTVGLVALKNNRRFIGIELNPEFCAIAEKRLAGWKQQTRLADW